MAQVVFLPGILGSELWEFGIPGQPGVERLVWIDAVQLLGGGVLRLVLDESGLRPAPVAGGALIYPRGPLAEHYGPILSYLAYQGHRVLALGYDWRLSALVTARRAWEVIEPWAMGLPFCVVCHSQGGLLARRLLAEMGDHSGDLARVICIGTPHWGSWEAAQVWFHVSQAYQVIAELSGWYRIPVGNLMALPEHAFASWPGMYELMPFRDAGPLHDQYPDQAAALYQLGTYARGGNQFVSATRLASAASAQAVLQQQTDLSRFVGIYGNTIPTPAHLYDPALPWYDPSNYVFYPYGDGTVTVPQGTLAGVPMYYVNGKHELLTSINTVQVLVHQILAAGSGALP